MTSLTNFLFPLWVALMIIEALRHQYIIHKLKKSPRKGLSLIIRFVIGAILCYLDPNPVDIPAYGFTAWIIQDTIQAKGMHRPMDYLNKTGWYDRLQRKLGLEEAFGIKAFCMGFFIATYFFIK
jgi:hypothetical protein